MHIERVQIEEGFLDGLDVEFTPGLNVIIGARGTGKTSLIELIRFCLDVKGHTPKTERRSRDHALSVLGSGQVTVIFSDAGRRVTVIRTADDISPRTSGSFSAPIIFSQTEIEAVGIQATGRLKILDGFLENGYHSDAEEASTVADVRSLTAEAAVLRRDMDELERQLSELTSIDQQIVNKKCNCLTKLLIYR
jgi:recombinational DNA repair ATPase RecF